MSSILGVEGVPVKVVRVEDMDKSTEGESIVPTGGEVGHRDRVILQTVLNPHQDHLLCTRARPEKRNVGTFKKKSWRGDLAADAGVARFVGRGEAGREAFL